MQVTGRKNAMDVPYSNYGGVWVGENEYDFSAFDRQIEMFKRFAPGCKIMVMLPLDPPLWWLETHPDCYDSYWCIGGAAFNKEWIDAATNYVKAFLKYAESKYDDDIFAYSFSSGIATEWFDAQNYYESKGERLKAYKEYSGGLELPTKEELCDTKGYSLREPLSKEVAYRNFSADVIANTISYFAKLFKEETEYRKIVGIFFGYTDCPNKEYQIVSSVFRYEKVWEDKNIDMLFSPASYSYGDNSREIDGASSYQYLVDSVAVNNKLYLHEIDHRTHLAAFPLETGFIPSEAYPDSFTTIEVLRRELATALCKGGSLWWFDFYGNYYASPELEAEIKKQVEITELVVAQEHKSVSEIAVFADASSYSLLKENLNLTVDYVRKNRNNLHKCGAPFDYYNLSDLEKIDLSQYKMLVFLYAPKLSEKAKETLKKHSDKLKVFIHIPDVASGEKLDFSAVEKLCGIKLLEKVKYENVKFSEESFGFHTTVSPIFKIVDDEAVSFAYYESGDVAGAIKDNVAYISQSDIPSSLWRFLSEKAGVHQYTDKEVPVYADSRFIACQFPEEKTDIIKLKEDGEYLEAFSGKRYKTKDKKLEFNHYSYQMMMFIKE